MTSGLYPASVTPFEASGEIDYPSLAKLLAFFETSGCTGVVLAGTNGEGPSLSAVEKRDLIREAMPLRGKLEIVLGIASPSLEEAVWLSNQAEKAGAVASLVMPPGYFREASEQGIEAWFRQLLDRSRLPIIIYNFPQRTGITLTADLLGRLAQHENFAGVKDSSSSVENLDSYAAAVLPLLKKLYVGDEALLIKALEAGWSGSISGSANSMPLPLATIIRECHDGRKESARVKHSLVLPIIERLRKSPQPATHKGVLQARGTIESASVRLPLLSIPEEVAGEMRSLIDDPTR
jgi:4-hydroxy-tetrahydrodipicolinate synthase